MTRPALVWFRRDLRLSDNPALWHAATFDRPIIPLMIDEPGDPWPTGAAGRWWLKRSIGGLGIAFWLRRGDAKAIIEDLVNIHNVGLVTWNRRYEPFGIDTDKAVKSMLQNIGIEVQSFNGALGREPFQLQTQSGSPYKVFTPYARAWFGQDGLAAPWPQPTGLKIMADRASVPLDTWLPDKIWSRKFESVAAPGETAAQTCLERFVGSAVRSYGSARDRPDKAGVSRLSPHLHWGEITPRQIHARIISEFGGIEPARSFVRQLVWRDFAHHCLYYFPTLPDLSLRRQFEQYPWAEDAQALGRWQRGETGFPIVDAGMRELWATGMMHNRVRMIAGSFLTKDLRIHWRHGARWFWDTLFDADLANNSMGWQWVAGSGIDAAPYFRIFNPTTQSQKFDPKGSYIRRWLPELGSLPDDRIHAPFDGGSIDASGDGGLSSAATYPVPIVDHKVARALALEGYRSLHGS